MGRAAGCDRGLFCPLIPREHPAGEVLARAGEPADRVWVVTAGLVGLSRAPAAAADAPDVPIDALRLPGSLVGVEALDQQAYAATARTLAPSRLCSAPLEAFRAWIGDDAERRALVDHARVQAAALRRAPGDDPCR